MRGVKGAPVLREARAMSRLAERLCKLEELAVAKRKSEILEIDWSAGGDEALRKFDEWRKAIERGDPVPVKETNTPPTPEVEELLRLIATFAPRHEEII